ncbi:MAG: hypothetical protein H3Z51_13535 [archaeon]|nr:hypothetical protein [archaeon]
MRFSRLLLALGIIFLILSMSNVLALTTWVTKTSMPTARGQAAVIAGDDGLIYVMGGYAGSQVFNTVEAYNPSTNTWATKASMPQATRGAAVAKGLDSKIYVFGGWGPAGYPSAPQIYDPVTNTWTLGASMPTEQWAASAATGNDGKIYVIGGNEGGVGPSNKVQMYDPSTNTWALRASMPTARLELGVIKGSDGLIYAIGGCTAIGGSAVSTVEAYNPSTNTWVTKASMPEARVWFGVTNGGNIYAIGGGDGTSSLSTNEEFITDADGKIYVIGGGTSYFNNNLPVFDTVFAYDPSTNTWTSMPDSMPTARRELGVATVVDIAPPTVTLTAPLTNAYINTNTYTVTANASDVTSGVASVEFLYSLDGGTTWTPIGTNTTSPYTVVWDLSSLSDQSGIQVKAKAIDNAGNPAEDINTGITLSRAPPPIWTQWWLWAIIVVIVIAIPSEFIILKRRKKPKPIIIAPPETKPV